VTSRVRIGSGSVVPGATLRRRSMASPSPRPELESGVGRRPSENRSEAEARSGPNGVMERPAGEHSQRPRACSPLSRPRRLPVRFIEGWSPTCAVGLCRVGLSRRQVSTSNDPVLRALCQDCAPVRLGGDRDRQWDVVPLSTSIRALAVTLRLVRSRRSGGDSC